MDHVEFAQATQALDELIAQLSGFPTPWGLKWIAQARGILQATFPLPNSPARIAQGKQFERWFQAWFSDRNFLAFSTRLGNAPFGNGRCRTKAIHRILARPAV